MLYLPPFLNSYEIVTIHLTLLGVEPFDVRPKPGRFLVPVVGIHAVIYIVKRPIGDVLFHLPSRGILNPPVLRLKVPDDLKDLVHHGLPESIYVVLEVFRSDYVGGVDFLTLPSNPRIAKDAPKQTDRGRCDDIEVPWLEILLVIPGQEVFLKVKVGFVPAWAPGPACG